VIDLDGHLACYVNDQATNLESSRVEGLDASMACSTVAGNGAALPAGSRKVSTEWHPDWRLKTRQAEPGRLTTWVYNGQADPFAGGTASCAPPAATLPAEGGSVAKPIAVLCKQVEQATTDTDGHLGMSAALQANVPNRQWSYTYNQFGQVLTAKGPRTDIDDTTRYAYYTGTSFADGNGSGHTVGDLQTVTNALGKVTQYTQYDRSGRVLTVIDPNQVTTSITYHPRGWVGTVSVGGQTTRYDYHPTGLLKRVTQPSTASYVEYTYDGAHRLTDIVDNLGNNVHYTLDNAGNRFGEEVRDPNGALTRQLGRLADALGRIRQTTGRE
jgi:uncharacterized protein RhaS with RHS repeats